MPILTASVVFSGFTSFLGSVYLLRKKSLLTFVTAMAGAVVNIILNLVLIPSMGAQGASIATLASYASVFVIRAINTKKYLEFSLHIKRMIINIAVIAVQISLILIMPEYLWITQPICVVTVIVINILPLISAVRGMSKKILKR